MSARAELWAWDQKGLQPVVKLALLAFAREACLKGQFTLKRKELATMLECSVDTVDRRIKALTEAELLEVRHDTRGGFRASTYRLNIPAQFVSNEPGRIIAASVENHDRNGAASVADFSRNPAASEAATGAASNKTPESSTDRSESSFNTCASDASFQLASPSEAKTKRVSKRTSLGETAEPSLRNRQDAAKHGFLNGSCDALWERFREYHVGNGTLKANWEAAFRTWILNEIKFREERNGTGNHAPSFNGGRNNDRRENPSITTRVLQAGYSRPVG